MTKEQKEKTKPEVARYISQFTELKLVIKPSYTKEVEGRIVVVKGRAIQFHDGVYQTSDPEEIEFLENHPNFGNVFYRIKPEEDAQKAREERFKDLEAREKALAEKERELREREMALKGYEEGAKPSTKGIRGTESIQTRSPKF